VSRPAAAPRLHSFGERQREIHGPPPHAYHEPDVRGTPARERPLAELTDALTCDHEPTLGLTVQSADDVQQRGLARARGSHQCHEFALCDVQVDVMQHLDSLLAPLIHPVQGAELDQCALDTLPILDADLVPISEIRRR